MKRTGLRPSRTIPWSHWEHLILSKSPLFWPPEKLSILEVQNPLVFEIDIAPTFFVQFWLAASQNDRTDCPLKMPYSRDPQVKRQISYWPREVQPLRPICSMTPMFGGQFFFGPGAEVFYVDWDSYPKFANLHLESQFFLTFAFFNFYGPTLGHVFGHVATCHVGVLHIKWKLLKHWYV